MARDDFLTDRINAVRCQHDDTSGFGRFRRRVADCGRRALLPSTCIAASLGAVFFGFSVLHRLLFGSGPIPDGSSDQAPLTFFSTLWQVQAGIAGAALPFLLLVIEFSKDETYATLRSSEVLIRQTFIFPVTCLALGGAIKIGVDTLWYSTSGMFGVDLVIFVLTAGGTLYAYAKAMQLMSSRTRMRREAVVVLKERLAASIDASIDGRIGNNVLFKELERLQCEYKMFRPDRRESAAHVVLSVPLAGRLNVINLKKLERFLAALPRKTAMAESEGVQRPHLDHRELREGQKARPGAYMLTRFRELIRPDERAVLLLEKVAFEELDARQLEEQIRDVFVVSTKDDATEDTRAELAMLRNGLLEAIRAGQTDCVVEGLNTYTELARVFLERLKPFKEPYTRERVRAESSGFGEGWPEVEWIRRDFQELLDEAFRVERFNTLRHLLYFPISLAGIGLREGDYYLFHQFTIWLPSYSYLLARSVQDAEVRRLVVDRCWRYLKEFSDLYISHYLDRATTEERVGAIEDISLGLLRVFSDLLRKAFDARDVSSFEAFRSALLKCFEFREMRSYGEEIAVLKWQRERGNLSPEESRRVETEMALLQRILSFSRRLSDGRKQLLVGLNAWMLREWEGGKLTADVFSSWHKAIGGLGGPVVLWETLLQCVQHETEERFGWDWWLLDQHEGEVVKIDLDISLMQLFCLRAAEELKGRPAEAWTHLKLPVTRDTRYVADRVAEVVRGMIEAEAKWRAVLSDGGIEGLRRVLDMASEARALGREEEIDQLIAAPLDQDRVRQFKEEFLESWQEHAGLRAVVKEHGNFEVGRFAPKGHDWFGLNRLELKEVFAQAEFMSMGDLGREFGRWFGESENQLVLKQFVDALPRKERLGVKPEEVLGSIDAALGSCQRDGLSPAVLILGEWRAALMIEESQDFIAAGGAVTGPLCGKYRQVPVFKLSSRLRHIVLVVDLKAIGRWRQYEVRSESSAEEIVGEHVLFAVEPVSEEHARKLIAEQPEFKKDQDTGKELEDTEAVRRLRQRVHLRILQQFDFVVEKREAGFKILLGRE